MTLPLSEPIGDAERVNWLIRYIGVQKVYDKKVVAALKDASEDAVKAVEKYADKENISSKVAVYQSSLLRDEIRKVVRDLFNGIGPIVKDGQADAAEAAAKASLQTDADVLKILFPDPKRRKQFEASFKQSARQGIQAMINRVLEPQWPLSERIWNSGSIAAGTLDRKINSALARGASARELAKLVKSDVAYGAPGGTSYVTMRLARTEINNAYHAQSIGQTQDSPWVAEMEWHLSKVHKEQNCLCEVYADQQYFDKQSVPKKPHPQCMCFVTPKRIEKSVFATDLTAGKFDAYFVEKYGMPAA